jgi:hypothetical protein
MVTPIYAEEPQRDAQRIQEGRVYSDASSLKVIGRAHQTPIIHL